MSNSRLETLHPGNKAADLIGVLFRNAAARPDFVVLHYRGRGWTFEELADAIKRLSCGLMARGVGPGDRVVLHLDNSPAFAITCYACMAIGAIAVPLKTVLKTTEMEALLTRLQPSLLVCEESCYEVTQSIDPRVLRRDQVYRLSEVELQDGSCLWGYLLSGDATLFIPQQVDLDAPAVFITTSGTTGEPKIVVHTQRSLLATIKLLPAWEINAGTRTIGLTPMAHISGLLNLAACFTMGLFTVVLDHFDPEQVLDLIELHQCTWLAGVPIMIAMLTAAQRNRPRDLGSMQTYAVGSDDCSQAIRDAFTSVFGRSLKNIYGATEACCNIGFSEQDELLRGVPSTFAVFDLNGKAVDSEEAGELVVRGDNITLGYWQRPGVIESPLKAGWFYTGDLVREERSGELRYLSRLKDVIMCSGMIVAPIEVENVLRAHPAVAEAAVAGIPDPLFGQRIIGFVQYVAGAGDVTPQQILLAIEPYLSDFKMPALLIPVDSIPRSPMGKVDRVKLAAMAQQ